MLSRLLFPEPKSEHRDEAVHSALLPTGMGVRVDPRESGRQALLVKICPQENTRESASRRQRERASLCGRDRASGRAVRSRPGVGSCRVNERPGGSSAQRRRPVSCGWIHCEIRCWIAADPPAGDTSPQTGNTSNDKSVKVSTSYFKIEVSWR